MGMKNTKVKFFTFTPEINENRNEKINEFIKDKEVIDIKFTETIYKISSNHSASCTTVLIWYM